MFQVLSRVPHRLQRGSPGRGEAEGEQEEVQDGLRQLLQSEGLGKGNAPFRKTYLFVSFSVDEALSFSAFLNPTTGYGLCGPHQAVHHRSLEPPRPHPRSPCGNPLEVQSAGKQHPVNQLTTPSTLHLADALIQSDLQ